MKRSVKIISVLCMIAMLLGMIPAIGVSASGAALTVTPSATTVEAGDEFTVTVAIENNPGVWSIVFEMPIDTEAFEFVSASTTDSICGKFGVCGFDESVNKYKFNGQNGDDFSNLTADGTLVTVTLKAKSDAAIGMYPIEAIVNDINTVDYNMQFVAVADGGADVEVVEKTARLVLTPSVADVKAGTTFTVAVAFKNNPGVWSIVFEMPINTNVFEFVSASTTNSICGKFGICGFDETVNKYKFNGQNGDDFSNLEADGTLVTVTLKAKADAALDMYSIEAIVADLNTVDYNMALVPVADGRVNVNVVENRAVSTIDAADVCLGTDISIKYFATLDPTHEGAQMLFIMNNKEYVVNGVAVGGNVYEYTFAGVAPQCMGDNIEAQLLFEGTVVAEKAEYSVLTYCQNMLAASAADLEISEEKYATMVTLIADLLEYGAKAQIYRGYKTNALVNEGIEGATEFVELTETFKEVGDPEYDDEVRITAVGVFFDYANALYIKFTAPGMTDADIRVNYNDGEATYALSECILIDEETSTYMVRFDNVSILDYDEGIIIELQYYNKRWRTAQELFYSVNSYVYSMQNSTNTAMADLAKALYNYSESAKAFANVD